MVSITESHSSTEELETSACILSLSNDVIRKISTYLSVRDIHSLRVACCNRISCLMNMGKFIVSMAPLLSPALCSEKSINLEGDYSCMGEFIHEYGKDSHRNCKNGNTNFYYDDVFMRKYHEISGRCLMNKSISIYPDQCLFNYVISTDNDYYWTFHFLKRLKYQKKGVLVELVELLSYLRSENILRLILKSPGMTDVLFPSVLKSAVRRKDHYILEILSECGFIRDIDIYSIFFQEDENLGKLYLNRTRPESLDSLFYVSMRREYINIFLTHFDFHKNPFYWIRYFSYCEQRIRKVILPLSRRKNMEMYSLSLLTGEYENISEPLYPFTLNLSYQIISKR